MKLNPANTRLLVTALRSGTYEQTTSYLARDGAYCCLGVACKVAEQTGVLFTITEVAKENTTTILAFDGVEGALPKQAQDWLLEEASPGDTPGDPLLAIPPRLQEEVGTDYEQASILNDEYELTFDQIADCFEYTLTLQEAA